MIGDRIEDGAANVNDNLERVLSRLRAAGASRVFAKYLRRNNNSRQQIYLARGDWQALHALPLGPIRRCKPAATPVSSTAHTRDNYKASLDFKWLDVHGKLHHAPEAQLILYPKYPEIRLGSLQAHADWAPHDLLTEQSDGRVLLLGIRPDGWIIGVLLARDSLAAMEFAASRQQPEDNGVLVEIPISDALDSREELLRELARIHRLGWIGSKRLNPHGEVVPCKALHCGGYTLEAELGIIPNGRADPDYLGWEIKQLQSRSITRPLSGGAITLMTPNPDGGIYAEVGAQEFLRRYGYPDQRGQPDRINFGGVHRADRWCDNRPKGGHCTTIELYGYDRASDRFKDPVEGQIRLVDAQDNILASWSIEGLLRHWQRKHAKAAYIPSEAAKNPQRYRYGHLVTLAEGTSLSRFFRAIADGRIYYDPAPKLEHASTASPRCKERHQFRTTPADLHALYDATEVIDVLARRS